ncbi:hypothetical protein FGO68_gene5145 [Halteria grandinella]|uniref:Uncharacterized protein n=1 Tax=Halteria grandinella TaxID=5974 RepID=A0A8J8TB35_HALGN|nr:hypothetical protein FGO68_gene5145 [Halteria grandinella]
MTISASFSVSFLFTMRFFSSFSSLLISCSASAFFLRLKIKFCKFFGCAFSPPSGSTIMSPLPPSFDLSIIRSRSSWWSCSYV